MDNSPTEGSPVVAASTEPTAEATVDTTSAEQSQETISQPEVAEQEAVSEVSTADNINEEPAGEVNQQKQTQRLKYKLMMVLRNSLSLRVSTQIT